MKFVRLTGNSQVAVQERPRPTPGPGEVLIQTAVSALCGSEMKAYRGAGYDAGNVGHEAAGIVAELGKGVQTLETGQRVGVSAIAGCGHCDYCSAGQYTWCDSHTFHDNMHAEYFTIPANACHVLPDDVPWEVGVLITGDGLGVPYHTAAKIKGPEVKTIAIFGLGPIGLGQVMMQKHLGREVIGIDRSAPRIELAKQMGVSHVIPADEGTDVVDAVRRLTNGRGADVCIEAVGAPQTVKMAFEATRKGGTVVFNGELASVELSPSQDFIRRDIAAVGSWFYHFSEYASMLELYRQGLPVAALVTHQFPIDQASQAFRMMDGQSGKVLLTYL